MKLKYNNLVFMFLLSYKIKILYDIKVLYWFCSIFVYKNFMWIDVFLFIENMKYI